MSLIARAVALEVCNKIKFLTLIVNHTISQNVEVLVNLPWFLLSLETSEWATWSGDLPMASPRGLASLFVAAGRGRRARCGFVGLAQETSQRWKDIGWKLFPRGLKLTIGRGRRAEGKGRGKKLIPQRLVHLWQSINDALHGFFHLISLKEISTKIPSIFCRLTSSIVTFGATGYENIEIFSGGEKWTQAWRKQFKRRWQNLTKNLRGQILWWNWERSMCEGFLFNRNGDKRKACFSNMLW